MSYATAQDGSKIWYQVRGMKPGATPLLLIQGLALDHHGWDSAIDDFDDRPVIVFDHRGTGSSDDHFPERWSTADFARDAVAVLDAAGVSRAMVYGHSMGGRIAQWLGASHTRRVAALVLGATTVGDVSHISRPQHASEALNSGNVGALTSLFYREAWLASHPDEAKRALPAPSSPRAMSSHLSAVALHDGPQPREIPLPTLILHGADDELTVVANAHLLAEQIPNSDLRVFQDERHVYWVTSPTPHSIVRRFLDEQETGVQS